MADPLKVEYDKAQLRLILKSFKAMSDEAIDQSKKVGYELAQLAAGKIRSYAVGSRYIGSSRIAENVKVSKSSKIGEFAYGYKSQRVFSGGASTEELVAGLEFGSSQYPQFPNRSPQLGRGSAGYFIYPTLRKIQPELIDRWEKAFDKILKEFD
jgi:hypothetical protein